VQNDLYVVRSTDNGITWMANAGYGDGGYVDGALIVMSCSDQMASKTTLPLQAVHPNKSERRGMSKSDHYA
jgi:hypothetical protein